MNIKLIQCLLAIKNASLIKKEKILVQNTDLNQKIITLLYNEGFILSFRICNDFKEILIFLKYSYNKDFFKNGLQNREVIRFLFLGLGR